MERGGAAAERPTAPHTHRVEEKGASRLQEFSLGGWDCH